jgi:hypothetical protein
MHTQSGAASASVKLRTAQFRRYAEARGFSSDAEIAGHTGLSRTTVFRLLRGDVAPGERIIATLLTAFPDRHFEDLFEIAHEPRGENGAAA